MPLLTTGSGTYPAIGGGGYAGPGNIVSGAITWGSPARSYSAAFAAGGTAIMDIVDSGGINPATINILATGFVDLVTLNAWIVAHGTASVAKLYDQTGNGNHFTATPVANMPTLTQSALNGLPGLTAAGAVLLTTGNITQAAPLSFSYVSKRTGGATLQNVFSISGGTIISGYAASASNATLIDTGTLTATASDNAFHAFQMAVNTTGTVVVDGAATTGSLGTVGLSATPLRMMSANGGGASLTGIVMEAGMWPVEFNATQYGNLNTNQHGATSGYNF